MTMSFIPPVDYTLKYTPLYRICELFNTGRKIGESGVLIPSIRNLESGSSEMRMIYELNV
jgi:hypothetical protein